MNENATVGYESVKASNGLVSNARVVSDAVFGPVMLLDGCPEHLLSFSQLMDMGWSATYDKDADLFRVTKEGYALVFRRNDRGLYAYESASRGVYVLVRGKDGMNEQDRLNEAVSLHERLGHRSDKYLARTLQGGSIVTDVTAADVQRLKTQMDPCVPCQLGGMKRYPKRSNAKDVPSSVFGSDLHVDVMEYRGLLYLVAVEEAYGFMFARKIKSRSTEELREALTSIKGQIISYGHDSKIKRLYSDLEAGVKANENWLNLNGIRLNVTEAQGHEGMAERAIQTIKRTALIQESALAYELHADMREESVLYAVQAINMVVNKRTWTTNNSPWYLATGKSVDVRRHVSAVFGEVLMFLKPYRTGSHVPKGEWGIYLGSIMESTGAMRVKLIETGEKVVRKQYKRFEHPPADILKLIQTEGEEDRGAVVDRPELADDDFDPSDDSSDTESDCSDDSTADTDSNLVSSGIVNEDPVVPVDIVNEPDVVQLQSEDTEDQQDGSGGQMSAPEDVEMDGSEAIEAENMSMEVVNNEDTAAPVESEEGTHSYDLRPRKPRPVYLVHVKLARDFPEETDEAYDAELRQFLDQEVFEPIDVNEVNEKEAIPVIVLFSKKASGKIKCRIVANGRRQDPDEYMPWEVEATTVSIQNIAKLISLALERGLRMSTCDIKGAYLNAQIEHDVIVKFNRESTRRLCGMKNGLRKFVDHTGSLHGRLLKALYGLKESALLWQQEFSNGFKSMGFRSLVTDPCIQTDGTNVAAIYVDDSLLFTKSDEDLRRIHDGLQARYGAITSMEGSSLLYRGLQIEQSDEMNEVKIHQRQFIDKLLQEYPEIQKTKPTPANVDLFVVSAKEKLLDDQEKRAFIRLSAKLNWLATQTRPDVKTAVSFLCSRVAQPTDGDMKKGMHVLKYLNGTRDLGLIFTKGTNDINAYVDAAYSVHPDLKGQSGIAIRLGNNTVYTSSKKQKLTAQSSTESEILAMNDCVNEILNTKELLSELGKDVGAGNMYEDNMSAIAAVRRVGPTAKLKHMRLRENHLKENLQNGTIALTHCPTTRMLADLLTKPVQGSQFTFLRDRLMGLTCDDGTGPKSEVQEKNDIFAQSGLT